MRRQVLLGLCVALLVWGAAATAGAQEDPLACPEGEVCIVYNSENAVVTWSGDVISVQGDESAPVIIIMDGTRLFARYVTYNDEERWAELEHDVRVEREGTVITADRARLAIDDERYIFEGNVYVRDTKSTPREIWADRMEYAAESGNMVAEGNVRMVEEKRSFTAARLTYDAENERAVLEGDVLVSDERGQIAAQRLDIDLRASSFTGSGPGRIVLREARRPAAAEETPPATE